MSILFYDHLVNKDEIIVFIQNSSEPENQKNKAIRLIDDIIHHEILHFLLDNLEESRHTTFLGLIEERPYDPEIIEYLQDHISPTIEAQIRQFAEALVAEIKKDLVPVD